MAWFFKPMWFLVGYLERGKESYLISKKARSAGNEAVSKFLPDMNLKRKFWHDDLPMAGILQASELIFCIMSVFWSNRPFPKLIAQSICDVIWKFKFWICKNCLYWWIVYTYEEQLVPKLVKIISTLNKLNWTFISFFVKSNLNASKLFFAFLTSFL